MRTAEVGWTRLETAEEDEAESRARGRKAPTAPAGPAGRVGAGRAGPGGAAGRVPGAFALWFPGWFPGLPQSRGRRSEGRDLSFNPFGTWDPRDHRDPPGSGRGARGCTYPKMRVLVPPNPPPRPLPEEDTHRVPKECPQPCPPFVPSPGSPNRSPCHQVLSIQFGPPTPHTRLGPPSLSPQALTQAHVPTLSPSLGLGTNVTTLCPPACVPSITSPIHDPNCSPQMVSPTPVPQSLYLPKSPSSDLKLRPHGMSPIPDHQTVSPAPCLSVQYPSLCPLLCVLSPCPQIQGLKP